MSEIDHNKAVRQISDTLKEPVAAVYDTVLTSSDLLHGCLLIFRKLKHA